MALEKQTVKKPLTRNSFMTRSLRREGRSALVFLATLVTVIALNIIVGRLPWKLDLTEDRIFTLSKQTLELLDGLKTDISIVAVFSAGSADPMLEEILGRYAARSRRITVSKVDPERNPGFVKSVTALSAEFEDGTIVVSGGDRFRIIDQYSLYETNTNDPERPYLAAISAERRLTDAIEYIGSKKNATVYSIIGHGETSLSSSGLARAVRNRIHDFADLDLSSVPAIPADAEAVSLVAPTSDLSAGDAEKLRAYLEGGGRAAVLLGNAGRSGSVPVLDGLLKSYGIIVRNDLVVEGDRELTSPENPLWVLPQWTRHEILVPFVGRDLRILLPKPESIDRLDLKRPTVTINILLASSQNSWAKAGYREGDSLVRREGDTAGSLALAVAITDKSARLNGQNARLLVIGCADFLSERFISIAPGNLEFFLSGLDWLAGKEMNVSIPSKSLRKAPLEIGWSETVVLAVAESAILPLLIFGVGMIMWLKRRHL